MNKKKIILMLFLSLFILVGCEEIKEEKKSKEVEVKGDVEIGESFKFMNYDIKINNIESFLKIDKELSVDHGKEVFKLPVEIKNIGDQKDHLSMFYYKMYSPDRKEIMSKGAYYDDSLDFAPDINPGDSYTKYIYIPYEGDGKYILEFNDFSNKIKIILSVTK